MRLPQPPRWLIELCLATDTDGINRASAFAPEPAEHEAIDQDRVYLGALYTAFEHGLIPMDKLLRDAGEFADVGNGNIPCCEAFYFLLNEIDGGGPTNASDRPLMDRVREIFEPMAADARRSGGILH